MNQEKVDKQDIKNMTLDEIENLISSHGKEKYRARQIMKWLYQNGSVSFDEMTNISKKCRAEFGDIATISALPIEKERQSVDGTKKFLFKLNDGQFIETVLIREKNHWTICVSTQAGCNMGCAFCLTGRYGLVRNLLPSEIVDQITRLRFNTIEGENIKNIVMMGMGEPLANYDNVLKAIKIITTDACAAFSTRRITVSTCGIAPMIERLGRDSSVNLAVSLNAPDNATRNRIMPVNRKYPIETLIETCRSFPMPRRRRITFEYILINGVNDSDEQAKQLATLMRGTRCKFNLIPFNEFPGSEFRTPPQERIDSFRNILIKQNYTAVIRASKGRDILAACGQLRGMTVN